MSIKSEVSKIVNMETRIITMKDWSLCLRTLGLIKHDDVYENGKA